MAIELRDGDYVLVEGMAWLTVGNISIRIIATDEGVVCDMYPFHSETDGPLASCYAFYNETGE